MSAWIALGLLVIAGLALVLHHDAGSIGGFELSTVAALVAGLALLIFYLPGILGDYRGQLGRGLQHAVIWGCGILALMVGYTYRHELTGVSERLVLEVTPPGTATSLGLSEGRRVVRVRKSSDNAFHVRAEVNGRPVTFVVDTGATSVVLKSTEAEKLGIDLAGLTFSVPVATANGMTSAAPIKLESIFIGGIGTVGLEALVAKPGALSENLLGMTFLSRLRSYEFSGDYLTLRE